MNTETQPDTKPAELPIPRIQIQGKRKVRSFTVNACGRDHSLSVHLMFEDEKKNILVNCDYLDHFKSEAHIGLVQIRKDAYVTILFPKA